MKDLINFLKESLILEKRGIFNGASEIAECIYDIIFVDGHSSDTTTITRDDLQKKADKLGIQLQNVFFNTVNVEIDNDYEGDEVAGKFNIDESEFNDIEDVFDNISISILYDPDMIPGKSDVIESLIHELTHAYTEWNLRLKGLTLMSGEKNSVKTAEYYEKLTDEMNDDNIGAYFLYLLYGHEKNAFFSMIANTVRKYNSWTEASEALKKDKAYKEYLGLFAVCSLKKNGKLDKDVDQSIVDTWRKLNKNNATDEKIWKDIINDVIETKKKLRKIVMRSLAK